MACAGGGELVKVKGMRYENSTQKVCETVNDDNNNNDDDQGKILLPSVCRQSHGQGEGKESRNADRRSGEFDRRPTGATEEYVISRDTCKVLLNLRLR